MLGNQWSGYSKPPEGTLINWRDPIAKNLKFVVIANRRLPINIVTGKFPTLATGAADVSFNAKGVALDTSGTFSLQYGRTGADEITIGTVFVVARMRTNGGAGQRIIGSGENSNGDGWELAFDDASQVTNGYFIQGNNGGIDNSGFDVLGSNSENFAHSVMVTWTGTAAGMTMYSDGKFDKSNTNTFAPNANANRVTKVGCSRNDGSNLNGQIVCAYVWGRVLMTDEYFRLHANPYCFMSKKSQLYFSPPPASSFMPFVFQAHLLH